MSGLQNSDNPDLAGFDLRNFARIIRVRMDADGRGMRKIAPEVGVTYSDLSRASGGKQIGVGKVIALCDWIGVDIRTFYQAPDGVSRVGCFTFDQLHHSENKRNSENGELRP